MIKQRWAGHCLCARLVFVEIVESFWQASTKRNAHSPSQLLANQGKTLKLPVNLGCYAA